MSWDKINSAHQQKYNRSYVACQEPEEREYLRVLITVQFPFLRKTKIIQALDKACREIESPRDRNAFLKYLEGILAIEAMAVNARQTVKTSVK